MNELLQGPEAEGRPGQVLSSAPILRAERLTKGYRLGRREVAVLRGVDLELQRGEMVAIRGASGAGKSTLLHLLGGLDVPDAGEVWFGGEALSRMAQATLARFRNRHIGFVFQAYHLLPELDALENVGLPGRMARLDAGLVERRARELLRRVGLGARMDHRPPELSGGEQQRVAIARALVNEPDVLLADEPTGNLDSRTGEAILELLMELRAERGLALVMATHDARVASHAPRVLELVDGVFGSA